ncbi:HEAT repeat domain-containing protein [Horticoccus sp. 23ND18S-11]|uniref:HEAT repeat domain-containing protein n=1 Tax=Horticoccus sp. 23ND18S-11 TaxID=3391832 RepID=UPI0039C9604A
MNALRSFIPAVVVFALVGCTTTAINPAATAALGVLNSEAGVQEKARACQELGVYGGPEAVPALAALLNHEPLADYARSGLEAIKDPSAGQALRQALRTASGRPLSGIVNSLGVRRESAAVSELQALALDAKRGVAAEAVASLGMIGTTEAAKALQTILAAGPADLRVPAAHAAFTAASQLARDGHAAAARDLLQAVTRSLPSGHLAMVAQSQMAALTPGR